MWLRHHRARNIKSEMSRGSMGRALFDRRVFNGASMSRTREVFRVTNYSGSRKVVKNRTFGLSRGIRKIKCGPSLLPFFQLSFFLPMPHNPFRPFFLSSRAKSGHRQKKPPAWKKRKLKREREEKKTQGSRSPLTAKWNCSRKVTPRRRWLIKFSNDCPLPTLWSAQTYSYSLAVKTG